MNSCVVCAVSEVQVQVRLFELVGASHLPVAVVVAEKKRRKKALGARPCLGHHQLVASERAAAGGRA